MAKGFSFKTLREAATVKNAAIGTGVAVGAYQIGKPDVANDNTSEVPQASAPATQVDVNAPISVMSPDTLLRINAGGGTSKTITKNNIQPLEKVPEVQFRSPAQERLYRDFGVVERNGVFTNAPLSDAEVTNQAAIQAVEARNAATPLGQWALARKQVADVASTIIAEQDRVRRQYLNQTNGYTMLQTMNHNLQRMAASGDATALEALLTIAQPRLTALENQATNFATNVVKQDPRLQKAALQAQAELEIAAKNLAATQETISQTVRDTQGDVKKLINNPVVRNFAFLTGQPIADAATVLTTPGGMKTPAAQVALDAAANGEAVPVNPGEVIAANPETIPALAHMVANASALMYGLPADKAGKVGTAYREMLVQLAQAGEKAATQKNVELQKLFPEGKQPTKADLEVMQLQVHNAKLQAIQQVQPVLQQHYGMATLAEVLPETAQTKLSPTEQLVLEAVRTGDFSLLGSEQTDLTDLYTAANNVGTLLQDALRTNPAVVKAFRLSNDSLNTYLRRLTTNIAAANMRTGTTPGTPAPY